MAALQKFNVTVRVFDPAAAGGGETLVLPVDSPDAEHAVSAAMSNAVAFTTKLGDGGEALPVAFRCLGVETRPG